jgi:hypothetical protein
MISHELQQQNAIKLLTFLLHLQQSFATCRTIIVSKCDQAFWEQMRSISNENCNKYHDGNIYPFA